MLVKLIYSEASAVDHITLLTLRMGFSLPFFLIISAYKHYSSVKEEPLSNTDWFRVFCLGVGGYYLSSVFDFWGLEYVTASLERLILFIYPTMVVLISLVVFRKKANKVVVWSLVLAYSGISIVLWGEDVGVNQDMSKGSILIFFAAITYAGYLVGSEKMIHKLGNARYTSLVMSIASVCVILHFALTHSIYDFNLPTIVFIQAIIMAIFCTVIPAFLISYGIKSIGASNAAIIASIGPVSTIFLAHYFLGETIEDIQVIGTFFVIAGVVLTSIYGNIKK